MNKKLFVISLLSFCLASCSKTRLLYTENAYNSPIFDENYYTEWEDIKSLKINQELDGTYYNLQSNDDVTGLVDAVGHKDYGEYVWFDTDKNKMFGYHNNLDLIEPSFNYGILSKLYDGRVRCDGYYQKSRVQLDKTGYATYFPKSLIDAKYIAFACRGGTTCKQSLGLSTEKGLLMNFKLCFYQHITNSDSYDKIVYSLENVRIETDNAGNTDLVSFYLTSNQLNGVVAMSLEWECIDERMESFNITDDYKNKEKDHLALMLYEVFIGDSVWY